MPTKYGDKSGFKKAADPVTCSTGGCHEWSYLGGLAQAYRCNKCGGLLSKTDLKEATDA